MSSDDSFLALDGPGALSAFRARGLLARVQAIDPSAAQLHAQHVHFVHVRGRLGETERARLVALLDYGEAAAPLDGRPAQQWLVVPRLGTVSPWASKATDIAHNCGLNGVLRIERGTRYSLLLKGGLFGARGLEADAGAAHRRAAARPDDRKRRRGRRRSARSCFRNCRASRWRASRSAPAAAGRWRVPMRRWGWRCPTTRSTICSTPTWRCSATRPTSS